MSERLPKRAIAASAALLLGVGALSGCSRVQSKERVLAGTCYTNYMGNIKDVKGEEIGLVSNTILKLLETDLIAKTGSNSTDGYKGISDTAKHITEAYVAQHAELGENVSDDIYTVAAEKPFTKALFNVCVDTHGNVTAGKTAGIDPADDTLDKCILIYKKYVDAMRENSEQLANDCHLDTKDN